MKTLDEVIKAWSICFSDNTGCPYADEDGESACFNHDREDALIYLKAYRWQMTNPDGDHQQLEKCRALLSDFYRNDPLSWDELRQMEGKPVYVKLLGAYESYPNASRWMLVQSDVSFGNAWFIDRSRARYCFYEKDMNEIWQAYRNER